MQRDVSDRLDGLIDVNRRQLLKGVAVTPLAGVSLPANASEGDGPEITVTQNGQEVATVSPITTDRSVRNFYWSDGNFGTNASPAIDLLENDVSSLFFYRQSGSDKISLVLLHDARHDGSGGAVTFDFSQSRLPEGDGWVVQEESHDFYGRTAADWIWGACCPDGGAYRGGFDEGTQVTIEPSFNGIDQWRLLDGEGEGDWSVAASFDVPADPHTLDPLTLTVGSAGSVSLDQVADEKLALAGSIDGIAQNIEEVPRVEATIDDLQSAVDAGDVDVEEAIEAVERMKLGENVTETVLAGMGPTKLGAQQPDTLVGSPIDDHDVAGETASLALSLVVELALAGLAIARFLNIVPPGTLGSVVQTAKRKIDSVIDWVIRTLLGSLGSIVRDVQATADTIKQALFALIESGVTDGPSLATSFLEDVADARDTLANSLVGHFETDKSGTNIDDKLRAFDERLDANGEIGPDFSGSFSDAETAAEDGIQEVQTTFIEAEGKLGVVKGVLDLTTALTAIAGILTASVWGAPVGAVATVAGILTTIAINSLALNAGYMSMERILFEHNEALDAVLNGNPDVPDATPDS